MTHHKGISWLFDGTGPHSQEWSHLATVGILLYPNPLARISLFANRRTYGRKFYVDRNQERCCALWGSLFGLSIYKVRNPEGCRTVVPITGTMPALGRPFPRLHHRPTGVLRPHHHFSRGRPIFQGNPLRDASNPPHSTYSRSALHWHGQQDSRNAQKLGLR